MPRYKAGDPTQQPILIVPKGEYTLKVVDAEEVDSKAGNEMIKLKLGVMNEDGTISPFIFDNLVFTEKAFWKIDQFLNGAGQHPGVGEDIDLTAGDCVGMIVRAEVDVDLYKKSKDDPGRQQNRITAYIPYEDYLGAPGVESEGQARPAPLDDDEIAF